MRRTISMLAAAASLAAATPVQADQITGWKNWADHAERVMTAVRTNNQPDIDAACIGTTRTIISQGFQFPYWGQMLPQFCGRVQTENTRREITLRGWMQECKQLRQVKGALAKSTPIDSEPRAKPLADEMVATLEALDTRECSHPPRRH
jgi:hypothetical protein